MQLRQNTLIYSFTLSLPLPQFHTLWLPKCMIHGLRQMSVLTDVHKQVQECVSIKCDIYEILCPVSESQHNVSGTCAREPAMFVS